MNSDEEVTLGELRRDLREWMAVSDRRIAEYRDDTQRSIIAIQQVVDRLIESLERLPYVRQDIYEERAKTQGERIGKLEHALSKLNYTAWTAVVLPILIVVVGAGVAAVVGGGK